MNLRKLFRRNKPYPALPRVRTWTEYKRAKVRSKVDEMRREMGLPAVDWGNL